VRQAGNNNEALEDVERARTTIPTPKRLKVGPVLAILVDASPSGGVALKMLRELVGPPLGATQNQMETYACNALMVIIDEWSQVKNNFELLNREIKSQGASESKFWDIMYSMTSYMQAVGHDADSKIQLLASRIEEDHIASDGKLWIMDHSPADMPSRKFRENWKWFKLQAGLPATDQALLTLK
jgi:hypothetical protein